MTFISAGAARQSYARSDVRGEFSLTTYDPNDGALIGLNAVTVVQNALSAEPAPPGVPDPETYFRSLKESEKAARTSELPNRYADEKTSGLSVTVKEGENRPVLELYGESMPRDR